MPFVKGENKCPESMMFIHAIDNNMAHVPLSTLGLF